MVSKLEVARARLVERYLPLLDDGRVHPYVPANVVAPCIWLESAQVALVPVGTNSQTVVATFGVVAVVDGGQEAQVVNIDALTSAVWDASYAVGSPQRATPTTLDVGGPTLRAVTVDVDVTIHGLTLCAPSESELHA